VLTLSTASSLTLRTAVLRTVPVQFFIPTSSCTSVQLSDFSKSFNIELLNVAAATGSRKPNLIRIAVGSRVFPPSTRHALAKLRTWGIIE
jgi:hypothetical protein